MSDPRPEGPSGPVRAHPAFIAIRTLKYWRALVPAAIPFLLAGGQVPGPWRLPVVLGLIALALLLGPGLALLSWYRFSYELTGTELRVHEGLLFRKQTFIPGRRVHAVDISAGVLERLLGVVNVRVQTAGGGSSAPEAAIQDLTLGEAEALRTALLGMRQGDRQAGTAAPAGTFTGVAEQVAGQLNEVRGVLAGASAETSPPDFEYRLDLKGLLLAATTSGRTWLVLGAIAAFGSQALEIFGGDAVFERIGVLGVAAGVALAIAVVALSWVASVVSTLLMYSGFTVRRRGNRLEIERGLLEHQLVSLSLDRIQAVRVHQGFVRRIFGYCEVHVDTAGFAATGEDAKQGRTILHPFLRVSEAPGLMDRALPGFVEHPVLAGLPRRARARYVVRWTVPALLVALPVGALVPGGWGWAGLAVIVPAALAGFADHAASAWGLTGTTLVVRTGLLGVTTRYLPRRRIQAFAYSRNPFQRRARLASVHVSIVSGAAGQDVSLSHVGLEQAHEMQDWFDPGSRREQLGTQQLPVPPSPVAV